MSKNGEIYTTGKNFYTAGGSDAIYKSHLCSLNPFSISYPRKRILTVKLARLVDS